MTIDETIKRCIEAAAKNKKLASEIGEQLIGTPFEKYTIECHERAAKYNQFAEWLTELVEAKRLLKLAVDDFANMDFHIYECDMQCDSCPIHGDRDNCVKWVHAEEALKLIEEKAP